MNRTTVLPMVEPMQKLSQLSDYLRGEEKFVYEFAEYLASAYFASSINPEYSPRRIHGRL